MELEQERVLTKALEGSGWTSEEVRPNPFAKAGDPLRMRGIPVTGFSGAIPGTRPDTKDFDIGPLHADNGFG